MMTMTNEGTEVVVNNGKYSNTSLKPNKRPFFATIWTALKESLTVQPEVNLVAMSFHDKLIADVHEAYERYKISLQVYESVNNILGMDVGPERKGGPNADIVERYYQDLKDDEAAYMTALRRAKRHGATLHVFYE